MTRMKKPPIFAERLRRSPCRPADWRWRRARSLVEERQPFRPRWDDALTGLAYRYLRWLQGGACSSGRPARDFADVAVARLLHEHGGLTRLAVQARLLAGQDLEAVSACTGLPPATVAVYEALFFNVLDRLRAIDWVTCTAIGPGRGPAPDPEAVLKAFAYGGGPLILGQVWPYLAGPEAARAFLLPPRDLTDLRARRSVALALLPAGDPQESLRLLRYCNLLLAREKSVTRLQALELLSDEHIPTGTELAAEILRASPAAPEGEAAPSRAEPGPGASRATAVGVAQRGERHGLGEARPPKVLLLSGSGGEGGPQGVPGPGPGRPLGPPGRTRAPGRAPAGAGGSRSRHGGGDAAAGAEPAAAGGRRAGLRVLASPPRPVEVLA
jgi:hypothetical protein